MSDDGLDNLFKKGLSGQDVKFNMASWRAMEQMLPPENKVGFFARYRVAGILAGFFLLGAAAITWGLRDGSDDYTASNIEISGSEVANRNGVNLSDNNTSEVQEVANSSSSRSLNTAPTTANSGAVEANQVASKESVKANSTVNYSSNMPSVSNRTNTAYSPRKKSLENTEMDQTKESVAFEAMSLSSENSFTKISGIGELSSLNLVSVEEDNTLVVSVSKNKLATVDKNTFGFIGGVNLNTSLSDPSSNKIGASEFLGLTYHHYFNGGLSLKLDLLYNTRNMVDSYKIYDKKTYGFGSKSEQTMVESQRLVYLELPAMVNYGMGNHNVMLGGSFSYLITGLHKVSTTYTSQSDGVSYDENMQWGYTNGFNKYDFSIAAGYEYNLSQELDLGMRLNYGLLDVTNNEYFGNDSFDNNVQFRFYLKYSPFKF